MSLEFKDAVPMTAITLGFVIVGVCLWLFGRYAERAGDREYASLRNYADEIGPVFSTYAHTTVESGKVLEWLGSNSTVIDVDVFGAHTQERRLGAVVVTAITSGGRCYSVKYLMRRDGTLAASKLQLESKESIAGMLIFKGRQDRLPMLGMPCECA